MKDSDKEKEKRYLIAEIIDILSLSGFLYGALDRRLKLRDAIEKQLKKPTPKYRTAIENYFLACLGGISFVIFIVQAITGVFLLFYYRPTVQEAYQSIIEITNIAPYGWLIRGLHQWGANIMVLTVMMHMIRIYFIGAYKPPRDLNWIVGVFLLLTTLAFGFTGYLLPWSQLSYWATTVVTEALKSVPFVGDKLAYLVRGGHTVGQLTLTRFFAIHVVILPGIIAVLLGLHFLMIRRQGISEPL